MTTPPTSSGGGVGRHRITEDKLPPRIDINTKGRIGRVVMFGRGGHAQSIAQPLTDLGVSVSAVVDLHLPARGGKKDVVQLRGDDLSAAYARDHSTAVNAIGAYKRGRSASHRLLGQRIDLPLVTFTESDDQQLIAALRGEQRGSAARRRA